MRAMVRLVSGNSSFREKTNKAERANYQTRCWLEKWTFEERNACHILQVPGVRTSASRSTRLHRLQGDLSAVLKVYRARHARGSSCTEVAWVLREGSTRETSFMDVTA